MQIVKPIVRIEAIHKLKIECHVSDRNENVRLNYFPEKGIIEFAKHGNLEDLIRKYHFQFEKVIRSAIKGNLSIGQTIHCVFIENFNFLKDDDYTRFIWMDRRKGRLEILTSTTGMSGLHKIYADGSFADKTKQSGYGGFIEDLNGNREVYNDSFCDGSSNLMELLAVTEGLQRLKKVSKIQVNTDSRYVIRGMVQWVHFWKYNNWQTAYGCEVKSKKNWQKIDKLCEGKFLEFNWIKGHSGHKEQDFCHQLARQSAINIKDKLSIEKHKI